ncbi:MAG TPA: hypothetical protein VGV40_10625, partial [Solirubrobacteraceae bacterium]|nr:hypothetical protein [Solirubrobacteraceae bacterium]
PLPGAVRPAGRPPPEPVREARVRGGEAVVRLDPVRRVLEMRDASTGALVDRAPAGAGPAQLAGDGEGLVWVTDAQLDALLVFLVEDELMLSRRVALPGTPWALVHDAPRERLWVTLTARDRVAGLSAVARPGVIGGFPSLPGARAVMLGADGRLLVRAGDRVQVVDPDGLDLEHGPGG